MSKNMPFRKRALDIVSILLASPIILVVLGICAALIYLSSGSPVLYRSKRRVHGAQSLTLVKFRTMRRDAEKLVNRDVVPITNTRFLNIDSNSPLYTRVGRGIERLMLTELPQLGHVLAGQMSLVGNRPLPENVVRALKEAYPNAEARFASPGGLTGPAQLVGRSRISDRDRLWLEAVYCQTVNESYSVTLDIALLYWTVVVGFFPSKIFTPQQVFELMAPAEGRERFAKKVYMRRSL